MGRAHHFIVLVALSFCLLCTATELLPRAHHAPAEPEALIQIRNVMLRPRDLDKSINKPIPRKYNKSSDPSRQSGSPLAAVKRSLLGIRQQLTCDSGYGLCRQSQSCCPSTSGCCDDGGCASTGESCCPEGGTCETGYKCCGNNYCAPRGGECCNNYGYCDPGLHCVILRGVTGCCERLDCKVFGSGGGITVPSISITPISIPSITIPSFTPISITPISFPSFTPISITPISFPSITIPTVAAAGGGVGYSYSYYTTTWTFYYYSFFLTTIPVSTTKTTSSRVTTRTIFSAYATNSKDAEEQFGSVTAAYASITAAIPVPTAIDEGGNSPTGPSSSSTTSGGPPESSGGGSGGSSGGDSGGSLSGGSGTSSGGSAGGSSSSGSSSHGVGRADGLGLLMTGLVGIVGVGVVAVWL